jgi:hypothetical protein
MTSSFAIELSDTAGLQPELHGYSWGFFELSDSPIAIRLALSWHRIAGAGTNVWAVCWRPARGATYAVAFINNSDATAAVRRDAARIQVPSVASTAWLVQTLPQPLLLAQHTKAELL